MREFTKTKAHEWESHLIKTHNDARRYAGEAAIDAPDPFSCGDGLTELLLNAIEHGNLEFGGEEKGELLKEGRWTEALEMRQSHPKYMSRKVHMISVKSNDTLTFIISDEGAGFDYKNPVEMPPGALNGRGILLARELSFDSLEYKGCGNMVIAQIDL
jgi:hypothetical protein